MFSLCTLSSCAPRFCLAKSVRLIVATLMCTGFWFSPNASAGPGEDAKRALDKREQRERLQDLAAALTEKRAALKDLDNESRSLLRILTDVDEAISRLLEEQERAHVRVRQLRARKLRLQQEIDVDEAAFTNIEARLNQRLRALYVLGEGGALRHLLGADSFDDLALRRKFLQRLAESDLRLAQEHARIQKALHEKKKELANAAHDASLIEFELERQAGLLQGSRQDRQRAIARIDDEKELGVRHVREIVKQQRDVRTLIAKLVAESPRARRTGRIARMRWPVRGTLLRGFGVTRESTVKRVSNGYHLRAKLGAIVAAPARAQVMFSGTMRGYGRLVILQHDGGIHTMLAHLSRSVVEKGDDVEAGQTIGFVGDTGSTEGAKLYFEVRKGGRPQDPKRYLR